MTKRSQSKPRQTPKKPSDPAEDALGGADIPPSWPCSCKTPSDCDHESKLLLGNITGFSDNDGIRKLGHVDVETDDHENFRYWFNQNGKTVFESAMRRCDISPDDLKGARVAIKFNEWVETKRGFSTKTYLIGLSQPKEDESEDEEEDQE